MTPIFMVKRTDGLTDNIFEYDFKRGVFVGGVATYTYDDIDTFLYIPKDVFSIIFKQNTENLEEVVPKKG